MLERNRDPYHNPTERQIITPRTYEEVCHRLALPIEQIKPGMRILSAGEGLSNFSRVLMSKTGAEVVALDAGYSIFKPSDTPEQAREKIEKLGLQHVVADGLFSTELKTSQRVAPSLMKGEKQHSVAGNVYNLPFVDGAFDKVVSTQLLEHLDFSKALPELLRVINEQGELWFGGEKYHVQYKEDGVVVVTFPTDNAPWYRGWCEAWRIMKNYDKEQKLYCYGLVVREDGNKRDVLQNFVIKKGIGLPEFSLPMGDKKQEGHHGDVLSLDIRQAEVSERTFSKCPAKVVKNIFLDDKSV